MIINTDFLPINNSKKTAADEFYSCNYINTQLANMQPAFVNGLSVTPGYDCYAEVFIIFDGWTYDGNANTISIYAGGSPTVIASPTATMSGHNTVRDVGFISGVFRLQANKAYSFSVSGLNGSGTSGRGYIKLTRII
jgi:hypothetical protein